MTNGQDRMYDIDFPRVYTFIADLVHPVRCTKVSDLDADERNKLAALLLREQSDLLQDVIADSETTLIRFIESKDFDYAHQLQKKLTFEILEHEREMLEEMFQIALQQYDEDESERLREEEEYEHFAHTTYVLECMRL